MTLDELGGKRWLRRRYLTERAPVAAIAAEAGVNPSTVHRWLTACEIPRRGQHDRRRWDDVLTDQRLRAAAKRGWTHVDVAYETGAPIRVVQDRWRRLGLDPDAIGNLDMRRRYEAGETLASLAAASGCSQRTVARRIRDAGGRLRPAGRPQAS